jgi:hypothetical protein
MGVFVAWPSCSGMVDYTTNVQREGVQREKTGKGKEGKREETACACLIVIVSVLVLVWADKSALTTQWKKIAHAVFGCKGRPSLSRTSRYTRMHPIG